MTFVGLKCQCQDLEMGEPVVSLTLRDCLSIIFQVICNLVMFFFIIIISISTTDGATMRSSERVLRTFSRDRFKFV